MHQSIFKKAPLAAKGWLEVPRANLDTLTYFSSAAIAFAFKTCQIFASAASVILKEVFYISGSILALLFEQKLALFPRLLDLDVLLN